MEEPLRIGGAPVVTLRADPVGDGPSFVEATVLPGRGFMLLQARIALPDGGVIEALHAPQVGAAARALDGGADDFAGNAAFSFGGAILAPFANRILGRDVPGAREIETEVAGASVRLPRNWGGRAPGARQYAMHGLLLAASVPFEQHHPASVRGRLPDAFGRRWPSEIDLDFAWRLQGGGLSLRLEARNAGRAPTAVGLGWHPYFRLPSGDRRQARLHVPARRRAETNDYDEVLPTGRLLDVGGTPHDFRDPDGRPLGDLYLDDAFTDLSGGVVELRDPASDLGLRLSAAAPPVRSVQVYAPPDQVFVVLEPQFNLADPFGADWPAGVDTGMAWLAPGAAVAYEVRLSAFSLGHASVGARPAA